MEWRDASNSSRDLRSSARAHLNCMKAAGWPSTALALRQQCRRAGRASLVRDGGARPAPERLHLCRFSDACDETQPYSGVGVWKPTGTEPADVEHAKVREVLWGNWLGHGLHGRHGVSYQRSSLEGTLRSRTQSFRSSCILMALSVQCNLLQGDVSTASSSSAHKIDPNTLLISAYSPGA